MIGRRGILKAAGVLPFAGNGKHKHVEDSMPWSNQQFQLLIVNAQTGGFTGEFVYSPGPGAGNLIASTAAAPGTDPYGNAYLAGTTTYGTFGGSFFASQLSAGTVLYLRAPGFGGPWSQVASIELTATNALQVFSQLLQVLSPLSLAEQSSAPATPTGAGDLYVDSTGHLHYLGPGGTNTILAGP